MSALRSRRVRRALDLASRPASGPSGTPRSKSEPRDLDEDPKGHPMLKADYAAALIECFLDIYSEHWLTAPAARKAPARRGPAAERLRPAVLAARLAPLVGELVHRAGEDATHFGHLLDPGRRQDVARVCLRARSSYASSATRELPRAST